LIEKIGHIKNPLTVIAIFAAIAEISGTTVLPFIESNNQNIYIWFLILFPILLVVFFFLTLNFNHKVLYAPSDYKDDKSFLHALSPQEQQQRFEKEVDEAVQQTTIGTSPVAAEAASHPQREREAIRHYIREAENFVIATLEKEYKLKSSRQVGVGNTSVTVDAVFINRVGRFTAVEVKFLRYPTSGSSIIEKLLYQLVLVSNYVGNDNFKAVIALVYNFDKEKLPQAKKNWERKISECPVNIELRFYDYSELKTKNL
jgi:hypothetical protein